MGRYNICISRGEIQMAYLKHNIKYNHLLVIGMRNF